MILCLLLLGDEGGEDAFAAMRRKKENKNIKGGVGQKLEVPKQDMAYCLEKVDLYQPNVIATLQIILSTT